MSGAGPRLLSLESRQQEAMTRLLERTGAQVIAAPSMREVPSANEAAISVFGEALLSGRGGLLLLLTGVGAQLLFGELSRQFEPTAVHHALANQVTLCCRGPKPLAVLKSLGLKPAIVAPSPNTWRQLVEALDAWGSLDQQDVHVQEYGAPNAQLTAALEARGGRVHPLHVYNWDLPQDTSALDAGIRKAVEGQEVDALVLTSAHQLRNLLARARSLGLEEALRTRLQQSIVIASIGPVTTAALAEAGMQADIEPLHPKMGHLALAIQRELAAATSRKRGRQL